MSSITISEPFIVHEVTQLFNKREFSKCITLCNDGLLKYPNSVDLRLFRVRANMQHHHYDVASKDLEILISSSQTPAAHLYAQQITIEATINGPSSALNLLNKVISLFPSFAQPLAGLHIRLLSDSGNYDKAKQLLISRLNSHPHELFNLNTYATICSKQNEPEKAIPLIEKALKNTHKNASIEKNLWFSLAQLYDKQGGFSDAFAAATKGNQLSKEPSSITGLKMLIQQIKKSWPSNTFENLHPSDISGNHCIFIIGMPRSGSTLTEQILQTSTNVSGLGEVNWFSNAMNFIDPTLLKMYGFSDKPSRLTHKAINTIAAEYIAQLPTTDSTNSIYTIDKNLFNIRLLGTIRKALPQAKIIWCQRHPLDSILSCYFQNFGQINHEFNKLSNITMQWHLNQELMKHWTETLGIEVLKFNYETLIENPEEQSKRLLSFVGLPWDKNCLAFHRSKRITNTASRHQVNQPLYSSSSGRWKKYEAQLQPAIKQLTGLGYDI